MKDFQTLYRRSENSRKSLLKEIWSIINQIVRVTGSVQETSFWGSRCTNTKGTYVFIPVNRCYLNFYIFNVFLQIQQRCLNDNFRFLKSSIHIFKVVNLIVVIHNSSFSWFYKTEAFLLDAGEFGFLNVSDFPMYLSEYCSQYSFIYLKKISKLLAQNVLKLRKLSL